MCVFYVYYIESHIFKENMENLNKSDGKRRNTLGYLDQYACNVLTLWNSRDRETVYVYKYAQRMETMKQTCEAVYVLMALWWLYGGCVFPVVVRPESSTF